LLHLGIGAFLSKVLQVLNTRSPGSLLSTRVQ
jgi:hypothetical protein